jgi:hypothetical protein
MIQVVLHRGLSLVIAYSDGMQWEREETSHGWQDKSPDLRRGHVVGWSRYFSHEVNGACWRSRHNVQSIQCPQSRRQQFRGRRAP